MTKKTVQTFELEKIDPNNFPELQGFKQKQEQIVKDNPFVEVKDHESYGVAKKHRTALKTARTDLMKQDKLIASKLRELRTKTGQVIQDLIDVTIDAEAKQQDEIIDYEAERERIKEEKAEKERQRVQAIKERLDEAKASLAMYIGIMTLKNEVPEFHALCQSYIDQDFGEFHSMMVEIVEDAEVDYKNKVEQLSIQETRRLENERLKKEAEEAKKRQEEAEAKLEAERKKIELKRKKDAEKEAKIKAKKEAEEKKKQEAIDAKIKELEERNRKLEEENAEKEKQEAEVKRRIDILTNDLGLKFNFNDAYVGKNTEYVPVVDIQTLPEETFNEVVKDLLELQGPLVAEKNTNDIEVIEETEVQEVDFEYPKPEMIPLGDTDLTELQATCQKYIDYIDSPEYHEDNDFKQYIFETAIETFFGKDAWDFINNRRK